MPSIKRIAIKTTCSAIIALSATSACQAADAGTLYLGGAVGRSDYNLNDTADQCKKDLAAVGITATCDISSSDTGFDLFAGFNISSGIAI